MAEIHIPIVQMSCKTRWDELTDAIHASGVQLERDLGALPPMIIFHPVEPSRFVGQAAQRIADTLLVVGIAPEFTECCFSALREFENGDSATGNYTKSDLRLKENTPLKAIYRQMGESSMSVMSLTIPDSVTLFFLRSSFTIAEFQKQLQIAVGNL